MLTFTSESVCAGHPDKICDQISDAILDRALKQDRYSRVAVETLVTKDFVTIAGEVTTKGELDYVKIARGVIKRLGYTERELYFTHRSPIIVRIHTQSNDIAAGVDKQGAGDQGMMYGFACTETASYMPLPIELAHKLVSRVDEVREKQILPYLRPDGKAQVTVEYKREKPVRITQVVLAVPHKPDVVVGQLQEDLFKYIVTPVLSDYAYSISRKDLLVNGTGIWHLSGPAADTGVTGRKIVVDSYGGMARVGGGCFSGKDPTKVDRSGAYAARFLAKNIVVAGLARRCEVRLAYFIGALKPIMQEIETFGTAKVSKKVMYDYMDQLLDTSVAGIIEQLSLRQPFYEKTAVYGHFGRDGFPWEQVIGGKGSGVSGEV